MFYKALKIENPSVASLCNTGLIRVSGIGAAAFLQGQLTCDMTKLANISSLAAHCNTKGRVRALYRVFQQGPDFYLRCPNILLDKALSFLAFYARFSKVNLTPINHSLGFGILVPIDEVQTLPFAPLQINEVYNIDDYTVIRVPGTAEWNRYEIYPISKTNIEHLDTNIMSNWLSSLSPLSENQWDLSNILSGIPDIFPETSEQFLPHDISLPELGAIDFNKGCYIGQEIIARMEYRSKQRKYRLALTEIVLNSPKAIPKPGDRSADGLSIFVSVAQCPDHLSAVALAQTPVVHESRT